MGKPFATVEYCYLNNFEVRHEPYQGTVKDGDGKGVPAKFYRVFANFQYDLLDADKNLINRTMSKLTLQEGLVSDVTAVALLDLVAASSQVIKDHVTSVKTDKSGYIPS